MATAEAVCKGRANSNTLLEAKFETTCLDLPPILYCISTGFLIYHPSYSFSASTLCLFIVMPTPASYSLTSRLLKLGAGEGVPDSASRIFLGEHHLGLKEFFLT